MNRNLTKLIVTPIHQFQKGSFDKGVYFGIWSFGDIVNSIKFTHREPLNFNIFKEVEELKKKYPEFDSDYYQRLVNDERTKKVIQFITKEIVSYQDEKKDTLITFPTSLILSLYLTDCSSLNEYEDELNNSDNAINLGESQGVYFDNESNAIYLPAKNIMLVVDGQHRLAGLFALYSAIINMLEEQTSNNPHFNKKIIEYARKAIERVTSDRQALGNIKKAIENFEFCCTILLDYDIWEQGKIFADVNFNQKPVNKSLYYDIFGSYPDPEKNDIFLAHNWTVFLNSAEDSALHNKIKLLGTGEGYFSQAFLVEALLPHLRKNGVWSKIVSDFIISGVPNIKIPKFLKSYFTAIKNLFSPYVPNDNLKPAAYKHILFKTTGLGGLIKLLPFVFTKVEDSLHDDEIKLIGKIQAIFANELQLEKLEKRYENYIKNLKVKLSSAERENDLKEVGKLNDKIVQIGKEKLEVGRKLTGEYYFSSEGNFSKSAGKGLQDRLFKELAFDLGFMETK